MSIRPWSLVPVLAFTLAGCLETQTERTAVGAAGGAVAADVLGVNPITGAVVGGAAGYFCRDLNIAGCSR